MTTDTIPSPSSRTRSGLVLTGFVLLIFCTGTAEFLVAGLLPQLAADVSVSIATAGQTVMAYALGVAIGGPLITVLTAGPPRKGLALGLGIVFVLGTILTMLAPTYAWGDRRPDRRGEQPGDSRSSAQTCS